MIPDIKFIPKLEPIKRLDKPTHTFYAITGGRGSGKSYSTVQNVLLLGAVAKKRIVCLREIKDTQSRSLFTEFESKIDNGHDTFGWRHNKNECWNIITGSTIIFEGMADRNTSSLEGLKGYTDVDVFIVDEAQSISARAMKYFIPLIRKEGCIAIFIFNRTLKDLPVWTELQLDNPPDDTLLLEVNYTDNPYCTKVFIAKAEQKRDNKPEEYEQEYLNRPKDLLSNTLTKYFKDCYKTCCEDKKCYECNDSNIKEVKYNPLLPIHIGCDFNVGTMAWALMHKTSDCAYYFDELCLENVDTRTAIKEFIRRYPSHKAKIILNGDASGDYRNTQSDLTNYKIILQELNKVGYNAEEQIHRFNTAIKNRVNAWNSRILTDSGERKIIIDPRCKRLIHAIKNYSWKLGTEIPDKPTYNQIKQGPELLFDEHIFDAASYPIEFYWHIR